MGVDRLTINGVRSSGKNESQSDRTARRGLDQRGPVFPRGLDCVRRFRCAAQLFRQLVSQRFVELRAGSGNSQLPLGVLECRFSRSDSASCERKPSICPARQKR